MSKSKTSGDMFETALTLRRCANAWEPDARILGNVRAEDIAMMCNDYARLKLIEGVSDNEHITVDRSTRIIAARKILAEAFSEDNDFFEVYAAQVAMLVHDQYGITDHETRNRLAEDILHILFDV